MKGRLYAGYKDIKHMPAANLIVNSSKNVEIPCGQRGFVLTCLSHQFHYIRWEKEGVRIDNDCLHGSLAAGGFCTSSQLIQGYEVLKLQFGQVNNVSEGVYHCISTPLSLGISVADQVTITVTGKTNTNEVSGKTNTNQV